MPKPWNVEVRVGGAKQSEANYLKTAFEKSPFPQISIERSLNPTPFERRAIALTDQGLQDLFHRLGLPPHEVPEDRVHIVEEEQIRGFSGHETTALVKHGHVFIQRNADPTRFYQELTHELVHAASFYTLQVQKGQDRSLGLWDRRLGLSFHPKGGPSPAVYFNGLSEGVTELLASNLRDVIATKKTGLNEKQVQKMTSTMFYKPWVQVTLGITDIVAKAEGARSRDVVTDLYRDYVTGSYRILKRLEKARPGAVKALKPLDAPEDALVAAELLDLRDLVKELRAMGA